MIKKRYKYLFSVMALSLCLLGGCNDQETEAKLSYREQGIEYMQSGNYDAAITAFDEALGQGVGKVDETDIDINYYKATAQYAAGYVDAAIITLSNVVAYDDTYADAYYLRGCLYLHISNLESAKADFDAAILNNADDYELYIGIFETLQSYGYVEEANAYAKKAFVIKGNEAADNMYRGRIYLLLEEFDNAETELNAAVAAGNTDAYLYLAKLHEVLGITDTAETYYQAYIDAGNRNSETLNALGNMAISKGDYASAVSYLEEAYSLEEITNRKDLMENLIIAYEYNGQFDKAWNIMLQYKTLYTLSATMQREYTFLENRQMPVEIEGTVSTETTEGTESVEGTEATEVTQ